MGGDAAAATSTTGTISSSIWGDVTRFLGVQRYLEAAGYPLLPGPILHELRVRVPRVRNMYSETKSQYAFVVISRKRDAMGAPTAEYGRLFVAHAPAGPSLGPLLYDLGDLVPREVQNSVMYMAAQAKMI